MSLARLKNDARKLELREEWEPAIQLYLQALNSADEGESDLELPLYNRVGDLYIRLGRPEDAVRYYERAADRYAVEGLYNNAIALCNKALRYAPRRTELLKKLGQFSASQGFLTDARRWFLEYAETMFRQGAVDAAFEALEDFAGLSEDASIRVLLARRLKMHGRSDQAVQELVLAWRLYERAGDEEAASAVKAEALELNPEAEASFVAEPSAEEAPAADEAPAPAEGADAEGAPAEPPDPEAEVGRPDDAVEERPDGFEATHVEPPEDDSPLPTLPERDDHGAGVDAPAPLAGLEATSLAVPAPPSPAEQAFFRARSLLADGRIEAALPFFREAHESFAADGAWAQAIDVLDELVRARPDDLDAQRQRAACADALGDGAAQARARMELGRALARADDHEAAREVYRSVLDLDPANLEARFALESVGESSAPPDSGEPVEPLHAPEAATSADYVDLGDWLAPVQPAGETRYFVEEQEPSGDEDRDFAELLKQLRSKIDENIEVEDAKSHYDLGLAFKDMGLTDEAIRQFQIALRSGDDRLKIYEELGVCFLNKSQHNIAVKVLSRALQMTNHQEMELIGVYYYLGTAYEALGHTTEARDAYERVVGLDVTFRDVAERLARL